MKNVIIVLLLLYFLASCEENTPVSLSCPNYNDKACIALTLSQKKQIDRLIRQQLPNSSLTDSTYMSSYYPVGRDFWAVCWACA